MKKIYLFSAMVMIVAMTSCSSKKGEVKQFVEQFAEALSKKDMTSINSMYSLANASDSLSFSIEGGEITVEEGDSAGLYVAKVNDKELSLRVADDGTVKIVDSRNVLAYGENKMKFALATGWIEEGMSDAQLAECFADTSFVKYLSENLVKELANNVRVSQDWEFSMHPMEMSARMSDGTLKTVPLQFVVVNNTPYDISADDYIIEAIVAYLRVAGVGNQKKEVKGENLSANSTTKVKYNLTPVYKDPNLFEDVVSSKIVFKLSEEELLQKYFIPKGGEYKN